MNFYYDCFADGNENGISVKNKVGVGVISMGRVYLCSLVFHRPLGEKIKSFRVQTSRHERPNPACFVSILAQSK